MKDHTITLTAAVAFLMAGAFVASQGFPIVGNGLMAFAVLWTWAFSTGSEQTDEFDGFTEEYADGEDRV